VEWGSIADAAAQVAALIRAQANGKAHVVGLSLGAQVALQLLNDHANVVDRAIMSGMRLVRSRLAESMAGLSAPLMRIESLVRATARQMVPADYVERFVAEARGASPAVLQKLTRDSLHFALPAQLAQVNVAALLVAGEKEPGLVKDSLPVAAKALPNARACLAPGVNHVWNMENPALFNCTVEAWFTRQPLPAELRAV
jgi:pimeloyl-ACP methyl ester carboxylesterase